MALSQVQKECIRYLTPPTPSDRGMTKGEFCKTIGLSIETLKQWQYGERVADKEFQTALTKARESYQHDPEFLLKIARNVNLLELIKGVQQDKDMTHKRGCIKELGKLTKDLDDSDTTIRYEDYTDEQLEELMLGRGLKDVSLV